MNKGMFERADNTPIERVTRGIPAIDTNHAQIHEGNAFSIGGVFTIAAGTSLDITLHVPADTYVHYQASDISTDGANSITAILYEGATVTGGSGTPIIPINRRRLGSPKGSAITIKQGATVTATGSEVDRWNFPKSASNQIQNVVSKADHIEWVLKQDCTYLFRISNTGTTTAVILAFRPFWYEEQGA